MNESLVTSPQQMEEVKAWPHLPNLLMEQLSWNADVAMLASVSEGARSGRFEI